MSLARHARSALSRGVGYEPTPVGRRVESAKVHGYPLDFSAKTTSPSATDPRRLVPAGLAQLALGWWERLLDEEPIAERRFYEACTDLERASKRDGEARIWIYSIKSAKYRLEPPWISGLAQAQAASVFVRAYVASNEDRYAGLARAAIRPLLVDKPPTVLHRLREGPVPEECPTDPPSLILNGWIYGLWGLWDVAIGLESSAAQAIFDGSMACLTALLPQYDVGWWSRYSLYPHRLPDLAKIFYHRLHVDQLRATAVLVPEPVLGETAKRWASYDTTLRRVALVGQKAAFVATGYR